MVTPMLLARRFTLNPVLVIISLVFWFWMWGIPGAILALPMLAITKIICDQLQPLAALGTFWKGDPGCLHRMRHVISSCKKFSRPCWRWDTCPFQKSYPDVLMM